MYEDHLVQVSVGRDLRFRGHQLAAAYSSVDPAHVHYSGEPGRWYSLRLWRTAGGQLVAERVRHSIFPGERIRREAVVCRDNEEVFAFFGGDFFAKHLYNAAGLAYVLEVA